MISNPPTGEQVVLRHGGYRAVVTELGAALRSLTWNGRPLIRSFAENDLPPVYAGAVLAPWPNRIAGGAYTFAGQSFQLPVNEVQRNTALHGLVHDRPWQIAARSEAAVRLFHRLWPTTGYPWPLELAISYRLGETGLSIELTTSNVGTEVAPYGCSFHPYLVAGEGAVDDWTLRLAAATMLAVDAKRLLPLELRPVDEFDFRTDRSLRGLVIDHAFTGITMQTGVASLQLRTGDGTGTELRWFSPTPWLQLCTGDRPEPLLDRTGLAAEPMTCPPDAFNWGVDLIRLRPGQTHLIRIELEALAT